MLRHCGWVCLPHHIHEFRREVWEDFQRILRGHITWPGQRSEARLPFLDVVRKLVSGSGSRLMTEYRGRMQSIQHTPMR